MKTIIDNSNLIFVNKNRYLYLSMITSSSYYLKTGIMPMISISISEYSYFITFVNFLHIEIMIFNIFYGIFILNFYPIHLCSYSFFYQSAFRILYVKKLQIVKAVSAAALINVVGALTRNHAYQ